MKYKETAVDKARGRISELLYEFPIDFTGDPGNDKTTLDNIELYSYILNVVLMDIDVAIYHGNKTTGRYAEEGKRKTLEILENNKQHIEAILSYDKEEEGNLNG